MIESADILTFASAVLRIKYFFHAYYFCKAIPVWGKNKGPRVQDTPRVATQHCPGPSRKGNG